MGGSMNSTERGLNSPTFWHSRNSIESVGIHQPYLSDFDRKVSEFANLCQNSTERVGIRQPFQKYTISIVLQDKKVFFKTLRLNLRDIWVMSVLFCHINCVFSLIWIPLCSILQLCLIKTISKLSKESIFPINWSHVNRKWTYLFAFQF